MNAAPPSPAPASASPQRQTSSLSRPQTAPSFSRPLLAAFSRPSAFLLLRSFSSTGISASRQSRLHFNAILQTSTRRAFLHSFLPFILFAFIVSFLGAHSTLRAEDKDEDDPNLRILTCTPMHSANWIWCKQDLSLEHHEYSNTEIMGKPKFRNDCARTTIGVAETINLKLVGKEDLIKDKKVEWKIIEGSEWGKIIKEDGRKAELGAKTCPNLEKKPRKIKVRATVGKVFATKTISVAEPSGIVSRHAGNATQEAKDTANADGRINVGDQLRDDVIPPFPDFPEAGTFPYGAGAWSDLDLIFQPTGVNFGGDFDNGVSVKEIDDGSPPKGGRFTPSQNSIFANFPHNPNPKGGNPSRRIDKASHVTDFIGCYASPVAAFKSGQHTCDWFCKFEWNGNYFTRETQHFDMFVINVYWLDDYSNGTKFSPIRETAESFSEGDGVVIHAPCSATTTVSKYISSVTRKSRETTQIRTGNWEP